MVSFDPSDALKVSGVEQVIQVQGWPWPSKFQPLGGVAVIARNTGAAIKGRDALKIVWDDGPNANYDSIVYRKRTRGRLAQAGEVVRNNGDVDTAMKSAAKVIVGEYYLPHLAHASMETPVATAHVADGKAEVWAPVQSPQGTRDDVAKTLGIPAENVTVNVTLLGGGFGRKSKCDFVLEAVLLSKAVGAPVKVQWTREDDIHNDFVHTVSAERIEAGIGQERQSHCLAAPQRRADNHVHLRRRGQASGAVRTRHGAGRSAVRYPQHPLRKPGSRGLYSHRLVPLGVQHPARLRRADDGLRRSPMPPDATRRTCCWS